MADAAKPKQKEKKPKSTSPFRDNIEVIIFAIAMSLGLKVFALEAYQIPTGSMQPTLMGTDLVEAGGKRVGGVHDRVLVDKICYLVRDPKRWEVVVFRYPLAATNNYVKRLLGLPNEELWIREGDLWARELGSADDFQIQRKPKRVQNELWKQVYPRPSVDAKTWANWRLQKTESADSKGLVSMSEGSVVSYPSTGGIKDSYRDGYPVEMYSRVVPGGAGANSRNNVSDLRFQFEATPGSDVQPLRFLAECGAFVFQLTLSADGSTLILPDQSEYPIEHTASAGKAVKIDFAFWDHHWELKLDGKEYSGDLESEARRAPRNGLELRSEGDWSIAPFKIWRDVHYLPSLEGGSGLYEVPEGEYFMMGDNTQNSLDSRDWTMRHWELATPLQGITSIRGDDLPEGHDPMYNNPRFSRDSTYVTMRDEWGDLFTFNRKEKDAAMVEGHNERVSFHTVPREYIQGKALAIFLPIPPFAPVWRIGVVH